MNNQFFRWLAFLAPRPWRKKYLLRNCSDFLRFGSEHLAYLVQLLYVHFVGHHYWSRYRHSFQFPPFQIFLPFFCLYGLILPKKWLLFTLEASASVDHSFLLFLLDWFDEDLWELCLLLLYFENGYHCFSSFPVDCADFFLSSHFWRFCYFKISFLVSNFVQHCGNLMKHCSGTTPPFHKIFLLIFLLLSCSLFPMIQLICHKYRFHSLV